MSVPRPGGVVIDTMVFSWLTEDSEDPIPRAYRELVVGVRLSSPSRRPSSCGTARSALDGANCAPRRLERRIATVNVSQPDDVTITLCAQLREDCRKLGHPLAANIHDDRWIAATAIRLGVPLVSDDSIFEGAPRLDLLTAV